MMNSIVKRRKSYLWGVMVIVRHFRDCNRFWDDLMFCRPYTEILMIVVVDVKVTVIVMIVVADRKRDVRDDKCRRVVIFFERVL